MTNIRLFDGAKGTMLLPFMRWEKLPAYLNVTQNRRVKTLHQSYLEAGSDIVLTNTVGVNYYWEHGMETEMYESVNFGIMAARDTVREFNSQHDASRSFGGLISAPYLESGKKLAPTARDYIVKGYKEQIDCHMSHNVPTLVFETITSPDAFDIIKEAIALSKYRFNDIKTIFSFTPIKSEKYVTPNDLSRFADDLHSLGCENITFGVNCGMTVEGSADKLNANTSYFSPSAPIQNNVPEDWAKAVYEETLKHKLRAIGGCCNTTPDHIRALHRLIRNSGES